MAWRRPGDTPLSEPMMVSYLTHICVTRPQWVKYWKMWLLFWMFSFPKHYSVWYRNHFQHQCSLMNASGPHWWFININACYGFVPSGTMPKAIIQTNKSPAIHQFTNHTHMLVVRIGSQLLCRSYLRMRCLTSYTRISKPFKRLPPDYISRISYVWLIECDLLTFHESPTSHHAGGVPHVKQVNLLALGNMP